MHNYYQYQNVNTTQRSFCSFGTISCYIFYHNIKGIFYKAVVEIEKKHIKQHICAFEFFFPLLCFLAHMLSCRFSVFLCSLLQIKNVESEEDILKHIDFVEDRPFNDLRYPMNSEKLTALGWAPKLSWEEGLQETSKIGFYHQMMSFLC